jgi:shikimate kinase
VGPALDKHVALIGFMGAGKTTLGAKVAERLGRPFVDLDRELERETGEQIAVLFRQSETDFRVREARASAAALERRTPAVLALGSIH